MLSSQMEQMAECVKEYTMEAKQKVIDSVCYSNTVFTSEKDSSLKMKPAFFNKSIEILMSPSKQPTQDLHLA